MVAVVVAVELTQTPVDSGRLMTSTGCIALTDVLPSWIVIPVCIACLLYNRIKKIKK